MEQRSEIRYDSNCAGIVEVKFTNRPSYIAVTGAIVNISTSGCLFLSDYLPWKNNSIVKIETKIFDLLSKDCVIYLPWINAYFGGKIARVGTVVIGVEFDEVLPKERVHKIADLEPSESRSFVPKCPWKYNKILPIAQRAVINQRR